MTFEKPKPTQLLRPITTGTNSAMRQSQFLAIICNSLKAQEGKASQFKQPAIIFSVSLGTKACHQFACAGYTSW